MRHIHGAFAILAVMAPGLAAQTFVYKPAPGSQIRITTSHNPSLRHTGMLDWLGKDSVIIRANMRVDPNHRRQAFGLTDVRRIEVNRRRPGEALTTGGAIGALAGLVLVTGDDQKRRNAVLIGALVGGLIGTVAIRDRWETVFRR